MSHQQRPFHSPVTAIHTGLSLDAKLRILSGAAKYDAACTTGGTPRRSRGSDVLHSSGVCHSWSADGRCIALLKVLYSNHCRYDCAYCLNRRSNNHQRASFTPHELAQLTMDFYRRNYIAGLFLSSAVFSSPDDTMERLLETLRLLRRKHAFRGYIHLKIIPGCSAGLLGAAAGLADRMSANIELPTRRGLELLAPEKKEHEILQVFDNFKRQCSGRHQPLGGQPNNLINPAGMSTQMMIGATPDNDLDILRRADLLYRRSGLQRVYYSAYIPVNRDGRLPAPGGPPPLLREHRLYQADWLLRLYRFDLTEILEPHQPHLDSELDPKAAWALRHLELFPLDVNRADQAELLRVPGIGMRSTKRILGARRQTRLRIDNLSRLGVVMKRARYFLHDGRCFPGGLPQREDSIRRAMLSDRQRQAGQQSFDFIPAAADALSARDGEL